MSFSLLSALAPARIAFTDYFTAVKKTSEDVCFRP